MITARFLLLFLSETDDDTTIVLIERIEVALNRIVRLFAFFRIFRFAIELDLKNIVLTRS